MFYSANKKSLLKFITQGFFATDGCLCITQNHIKFYPRVEIRVTHKELLRQVFDYLKGIGLYGKFYRCRDKKIWQTQLPCYKIQFNGVDNLLLFKHFIGFVNHKHNQRGIKFLKYFKDCQAFQKNILKERNIAITKRNQQLLFECPNIKQWRWSDLNTRPHAYETCTLNQAELQRQ